MSIKVQKHIKRGEDVALSPPKVGEGRAGDNIRVASGVAANLCSFTASTGYLDSSHWADSDRYAPCLTSTSVSSQLTYIILYNLSSCLRFIINTVQYIDRHQ